MIPAPLCRTRDCMSESGPSGYCGPCTAKRDARKQGSYRASLTDERNALRFTVETLQAILESEATAAERCDAALRVLKGTP